MVRRNPGAAFPAGQSVKIGIVSPAPRHSTLGNSMTAERYARIFRSLGFSAKIVGDYADEPLDLLVALHARKSAASALAFHRLHPGRPLIIVMTGTDLYRDIKTSRLAARVLEVASAIVVLQPHAMSNLSSHLREKTTSIIQSASPLKAPLRRAPRRTKRPHRRWFEICVIGHLRSEKDPLRAAYATRLLPSALRVRVTQAGRALAARFARAARLEEKKNARYRWVGELEQRRALRMLASSDLMVLSSKIEGGANVLCEAIASGIPVLGSDIAGNAGILGRDYPGLFPVGNTKALAALILRAVTDDRYYKRLRRRCVALKPLVTPARERRAWQILVRRLGVEVE